MKNKIILLALTLIMSVSGQQVYARHSNMTRAQQEQRAMQIQQRVYEIKAMDRTQLSTDQRKALKLELKGMRKELREMDPVVIVVSTCGLLLLILILLILL